MNSSLLPWSQHSNGSPKLGHGQCQRITGRAGIGVPEHRVEWHGLLKPSHPRTHRQLCWLLPVNEDRRADLCLKISRRRCLTQA
jgi:hypothetical protein